MKSCIIFMMVVLVFASCQKQTKECLLRGNIDTELDGKCCLYPLGEFSSWEEIKKHIIESDIIKGRFEIKIDSSIRYRNGVISLGEKRIGVSFFAESGIIVFSGKPDSIKIGGTPITDEYYRLKEKLNYDSYGKICYKKHLNAEEKKLKEEYVDNLWKQAKANPKSIPLTYFFNMQYFGADAETLDSVINIFSKDIYNTYYLVELIRRRDIAKSLSAGNKAPEFTLSTFEGEEVSLKDYAGKYLLIDFWASWCGPCRMAIPEVKKAYEAFNEQGLDVINISVDNEENKWLCALEQEKMPWKQLRDTKKVADLYNVTAIPNIFLVDREGRIVAKQLHGEEMWKALEKVGFKRK